MIGLTGSRPSPMARRRRLSRVRRIGPTPTSILRRGLSRAGFHGLVTAIGLAAAVTVWNAPRGTFDVVDGHTTVADGINGTSGEAAEDLTSALTFVEPASGDGEQARVSATLAGGVPLKPRVYTIMEGDTLRSISTEYSVSISTILASNKLDDPNVISPGQEILIPPIEGVVADVQPNETLAQIAERFGVDVADVAQANALPVQAEATVPYERIVVPGMETAERALGTAPRRHGTTVQLAARAEGDPGFTAKPSGLTYEVQDGDTVAQLATQFGVSVWTILTANNLGAADLIQPGMELKVLPVNGVEHEIQPGESLSDIAAFYKVDLGPLVDFNSIGDPDNLTVGSKLTIPGAERGQPSFSLAQIGAPATTAAVTAPSGSANVATTQRPAAQSALAQAKPPGAAQVAAKPGGATQAAAKPQAPTTQTAAKPQGGAQAAAKPTGTTAQGTTRLQAASVSAPSAVVSSGSGSAVIGTAMKYLGARYVFGGTSPAGFDCSGFVWYVHNAAGRPVSRGLWGQLNGGPRISTSQLQPGDAVFFANTYMPGLSHAGIYIGGGRFIHASDESSGVKISSLSDGYWGPRFIGASRLW